ncbi:MAG: LuxR C-terminal-related transcriptional regulator, partial [Chloroflexota bacterium]
GQAILADLERANLFVVPLDDQRQWYRYHHLFADLLKSTLKQQKSAAAVRDLHLRASRWHHDQGTLEEAMTHAMASGDYQWAAEILDQHFVTMFSRSEVPVLLGWMDDLPAEIVSRQPWVDVYRAYTLALGGKSGEAIPLLDQVERRLDVGTPRRLELAGHIAAIRAYIANLRGDVERVIDQAALAGKYLGQEHLIARAMAAYALADTYFAADELPAAGLALEEVLRSGRQAGRLLMIVPALCDLSAVHIAQGQLHLAKRRLDEAWDWLVKQDGLETRLRCAYEFGLANLLREWNDLDAAHEHVQAGLARRRRHGGYLVVGDLALMRVLQARGDTQGALEALQTAQEYMQTYHFQLSTRTDFEAARVVQWLAAGDVGLAAHWAGHLRLESEVQALALARLYLAQDRPQDAQRLLERQQPLAAAGGRNGRLIEIQALLALARQAQGQLAEADQALSRALSLARTEGAMRLFLDLGQPLYTLLQRAAGKPGLAATSQPGRRYEADLLTAFAREAEARAQSRPAEPTYSSLTERELEVVRLLAEGLSNKEMADRLVVAPSTIKQHLKNIYDKLDVHSRVQAVERGRQLDLL